MVKNITLVIIRCFNQPLRVIIHTIHITPPAQTIPKPAHRVALPVPRKALKPPLVLVPPSEVALKAQSIQARPEVSNVLRVGVCEWLLLLW